MLPLGYRFWLKYPDTSATLALCFWLTIPNHTLVSSLRGVIYVSCHVYVSYYILNVPSIYTRSYTRIFCYLSGIADVSVAIQFEPFLL